MLIQFQISLLNSWKLQSNSGLNHTLIPIKSYTTKNSVILDMTEFFYTIVVYLNRYLSFIPNR